MTFDKSSKLLWKNFLFEKFLEKCRYPSIDQASDCQRVRTQDNLMPLVDFFISHSTSYTFFHYRMDVITSFLLETLRFQYFHPRKTPVFPTPFPSLLFNNL